MAINLVDEFFNSGIEEEATLTVGGTPSTINIIFLDEYDQRKIDDIGYEGSNPIAICKTADVNTASQGDTLEVGAVTYKIGEIQPDKTGITNLELYNE